MLHNPSPGEVDSIFLKEAKASEAVSSITSSTNRGASQMRTEAERYRNALGSASVSLSAAQSQEFDHSASIAAKLCL